MRRHAIAAELVAAGILCMAAPVAGGARARAPLVESDRHFVTEAAQGGMAEVRLGQLASEKATTPQVKQFGMKMVEDHGKANKELTSLAGEKGWTLPVDIGPKHKKTLDYLAMLSGLDFDKAYAHDMVEDHEMDVAAFEKETRHGKDPDLKAWASKTLPTLRMHLEMAKKMERQIR